MDHDEFNQKLDQIEEQAQLTLAEFPKTLTKERQRMIIALVRYIRAEAGRTALFSTSEAHADAVACGPDIAVPALVIGNLADDACTPSHSRRIFEAIGHPDKERYEIPATTIATSLFRAESTARFTSARQSSRTPASHTSLTRALPVLSKYSRRRSCLLPGRSVTSASRVPYERFSQSSIRSLPSRYRR